MDVLVKYRIWLISAAAVIVLIAGYRLLLWLLGVVIIPDDSVGVVTKKFVLFGNHRKLPDDSEADAARMAEANAASSGVSGVHSRGKAPAHRGLRQEDSVVFARAGTHADLFE